MGAQHPADGGAALFHNLPNSARARSLAIEDVKTDLFLTIEAFAPAGRDIVCVIPQHVLVDLCVDVLETIWEMATALRQASDERSALGMTPLRTNENCQG